MNLQSLGTIITDNRKRLNLTQEQLAERIGVSPQAISKWENGWNLPDIDNLNLLSEVFEIPISRLFGEEPVEAEFVYRGRLFHEEKMYTRMKTIAQTEGFYAYGVWLCIITKVFQKIIKETANCRCSEKGVWL